MTEDLVTLDKSQTLDEAGTAMIDADIKSVVVSSRDERPVGILTSTDFVRMAADGGPPGSSHISEYMTSDIVTTTADTAVNEAAELMIGNDISHLPVVQADGRLTGIITTTDVASYVSGLEDLTRVG